MMFLKEHYAIDLADYSGEGGLHDILEGIRSRQGNGSTVDNVRHRPDDRTEPSTAAKYSKGEPKGGPNGDQIEKSSGSPDGSLLHHYIDIPNTVYGNDSELLHFVEVPGKHRIEEEEEEGELHENTTNGRRDSRFSRDNPRSLSKGWSPGQQPSDGDVTIYSTGKTSADDVVVVDVTSSADLFVIKNAYAEKLLKIAHILHYGSIAVLGVFVIQVRSVFRLVAYRVAAFESSVYF